MIQSIAKPKTLQNERMTNIHSSIKLLKILQNGINAQWISFYSDVTSKRITDSLAKKGTSIIILHTAIVVPALVFMETSQIINPRPVTGSLERFNGRKSEQCDKR